MKTRLYPPYTLRCRIFGCREDGDDCMICGRCGRHWYDDGYLLAGWFAPLRRAYWFVRRWLSLPRCAECRKPLARLPRLWPRNPCDIEFCSQHCADNWTPF